MHIKKSELFVVPQMDRPKELGATVLLWLAGLADDEKLIVGLPRVLGKWVDCVPIILGPGMQAEFWEWLQANRKSIEGPVYNLPALTAGFLCIVAHKDYDPRKDSLIIGRSEELRGVLTSLGSFMATPNEQEAV